MKLHRILALWVILLLIIVGLAACGSNDSLDDEARIQTRVAEDQAVATALTATAAAPGAVEPDSVAAAATNTPVIATNTPLVATNTPLAATNTPLVATEEIAAAEEITGTPVVVDLTVIAVETTPTPTATPVVLGFLPVDGNDGNDYLRSSFNDNQGRVVLFPGFAQNEISSPMVFRDRMAMRVEVFDTRVGLNDGAGIQDVTFAVEDADGNVVHQRTERVAGYCIFGGGEPDCNLLNFELAGYRWPDGGEIFNGDYLAKIDINPENGKGTQWRVRFAIDSPSLDSGDQSGGDQGGGNQQGEIVARIAQTGPGGVNSTVTDALVFQVEAYDAGRGNNDGDGIRNVDMWIYDPDGVEVHMRTENNAGYCIFSGGEPDCDIWNFGEHGNRWPNDATLLQGRHLLRARVNAEDGRTKTIEMFIEIR